VPGIEGPDVERLGIMRLEIGALIGNVGKGGGVGLAEAVSREGRHHLEHPFHHFRGVAFPSRPGDEALFDLSHLLRAAVLRHGAPEGIGLGVAHPGETMRYLQNLLLEEDHAVGLFQDGFEIRVRIYHPGLPVSASDVRVHHVALDGVRTKK